MGSALSIMECADITKERSKHDSIIVTVSAVKGITDLLLNIINLARKHKPRLVRLEMHKFSDIHKKILYKIISHDEEAEKIWNNDFLPKIKRLEAISYGTSLVGDLTDKTVARICAFGEKLSTYLILYALQKLKVHATRIESEKIIRTDNNYIKAKVNLKATFIACRKVLKPLLVKKIVPIVTGFIGKDTHGDITLLGRGGSDYTASIIATAFNSKALEIWTDVNGVMSADPRIVSDAKSWDSVNMNLMSEMAYSGAKVLHPDTIAVAVKQNIPVYVFNTFNRKFHGTKITLKAKKAIGIVGNPDNILITLEDTSIINQVGFIEKVAHVFKVHNIPMDVCATSEISFTVSIKGNDGSKKFYKELKNIASVTLMKNITKLCIIGNNIAQNTQLINNIFSLCNQHKIPVYTISMSASGNNITLMIDDLNKTKALQVLHDKLFEQR